MSVQEHNRAVADTWDQGGRAYDEISFAASDAMLHAVQRLWPAPGENVLDVATGTGWSARNAARFGANVTGVDIAGDLIEAAKALSAHIEPPIRFEVGDAEALPFEDGTFDKVISTFGVMFTPNHREAADELARVCRPGGRLVLATWPGGDYVEKFFGVLAGFDTAPPPPVSPLEWGRPEHVKTLLGDHFDLVFESGVTVAYFPDTETMWQKYLAGFGPVRSLAQALDSARQEELKAAFKDFHEQYRTPAGIAAPRDYLLVIGTKRE